MHASLVLALGSIINGKAMGVSLAFFAYCSRSVVPSFYCRSRDAPLSISQSAPSTVYSYHAFWFFFPAHLHTYIHACVLHADAL